MRDQTQVVERPAHVADGSNCEELSESTYFRVSPNNRHGAETLFAFLVPPSRCDQLLVRALSVFSKKIADGRIAIAHSGPRDVAGRSADGSQGAWAGRGCRERQRALKAPGMPK